MTQAIIGGAALLLALAAPVGAAAAPAAKVSEADKAKAAEQAKAEAARATAEKQRDAKQAQHKDATARREADRRDAEEKRDGRDDKRRPSEQSRAEREKDDKRDERDVKAREKHAEKARESEKSRKIESPKSESKPTSLTPVPAEPPAPASPAPPPPAPPPSPPQQWAITNATRPMVISAFGRAGAPDPGPAVGETLLVSFDAPNAFGVTDVSRGAVITGTGSIGGVRAAPAGNASAYRSLGGGGESTFDFSGWSKGKPLSSLSFEWGSIDSYNFVDFLNSRGETVWTLAGSDLPQFNGDQSAPITNQRLFVTLQREADIAAVRMRSRGNAFEFDSIAAGTATGAVPEPASWVMLILGFGFVGQSLRRRRQRSNSVSA